MSKYNLNQMRQACTVVARAVEGQTEEQRVSSAVDLAAVWVAPLYEKAIAVSLAESGHHDVMPIVSKAIEEFKLKILESAK